MEKEFIPYEQALALKELGFDEPCLNRFYTKPKSKMFGVDEKGNHYPIKNTSKKLYTIGEHFVLNDSNVISAPLYQQAFRWFREKHKLHSATFWMEIDKSIYWNYRYSYLNDKSTESVNRSMVYFNTPEEAELECLKKLIELVKEKN